MGPAIHLGFFQVLISPGIFPGITVKQIGL